jgi:broad specificity phosphatase PhoE
MLLSTLALGLLSLSPGHASATPGQTHNHIAYSVVPDIFLQSLPTTDPATFNFSTSNFGLIPRSYPSDDSCPDRRRATQWQKLAHYISTLNQHSRHKNDRYALLFLGRHGQGFHNAAESYFGTPAWNCYYSELEGNSTVTWADAHLTDLGIEQARFIGRFWASLISKEKIVPPETYYSSPLMRALQTAEYTFSPLRTMLPRNSPFIPTIKEGFREGISAHTCDHRSNKTYIAANFPHFRFERGFPEQDPYWKPLFSETRDSQDARSKNVLDDVFKSDDSTYISVTAHSGEIASLLRVLGHREFSLSTGAAIPVLVKVTTLQGSVPTPTWESTPIATCAVPPTIRDPSCNDCSCCT